MSRLPKPAPHPTAPRTTGESWDGIEELDTPLPRWWLWVFRATILFALVYTVLYPAWPVFRSGATPGLLHHTARGALTQDMARWQDRDAPMRARLLATPPEAVAADPDLAAYALNAGAAVFRTWCAQCHGAEGGGQPGLGYPSLIDRDWLWGGSVADIITTVSHGIRDPNDPETRLTDMPAFGRDGILTPDQIAQVVAFVRQISGQISGQGHDAALAAQGAEVFADNCAACHGDQGKGDRSMGAPDLTDAVWLYGGDVAALTATVTNARNGVMPAWGWAAPGAGTGGGAAPRLTEADIRAVAIYVHALGGGE